jgi:hypothetical protein
MYYDRMIEIFTFDNIPLLVSAGIAFGFGFWQYIYSFRLVRREGKAPFPIWMHTFYFAHDSSWAFMMFLAAARYDWNGFFLTTSIALVVWTMFELYNLTQAVRIERREIFSRYFGEHVTSQQAIIAIVVQILAFYAVVNLLVRFMGSGSFLQTAALTNIVMAFGPGLLWLQRGTRDGNGLGIALVVLLGTINTFMPSGMWVKAMPEIFDTPWYYITGLVFTGIAAAAVVMVARFPAKPRSTDGTKPIW